MTTVAGGVNGAICVVLGVVFTIFRARIAEAGLRMNEMFMPWTNKRTKSAQVPVIIIAATLIIFGTVAVVYALVP
jgi:hypothetical protein